MKNNLVRLSQCMIVKNEEQNIERALQWGKGIVSEQIVVDTGSTDCTVEIAKTLGASVYHYEWNNDFAAAKNYALEQASGNWIVFLDADEYYKDEDAQKLLRILERFEADRNRQGCPDIIRSGLANLNEDGSLGSIIFQDRVFQNKKYLRYTGRIHEYLIRTDGKGLPSQYDAHKQLTIFHTGYTKELLARKQERNEEMLLKELEQAPDDCQIWYYLGQGYMVQKDWTRAGEAFDKCMQNIDQLATSTYKEDAVFSKMRTIIWGNDFSREADLLKVYDFALRRFPGHPDADYLMGVWEIRQSHYDATIHYLEQALQKLERYDGGYSNIDMQGNLASVYRNLAASYREIGNLNEFVRNAVFGLRLAPYTDVLLVALLASFKGDGGEAAVDASYNFVAKLYDFEDPRNLLFIVKCAMLADFERLTARMYELPQMPRE